MPRIVPAIMKPMTDCDIMIIYASHITINGWVGERGGRGGNETVDIAWEINSRF